MPDSELTVLSIQINKRCPKVLSFVQKLKTQIDYFGMISVCLKPYFPMSSWPEICFFRQDRSIKALIPCNRLAPGDRPASEQTSSEILSWQHPSSGASEVLLGETRLRGSSAWRKYKLYYDYHCHWKNYLFFISVRVREIKLGRLLATTAMPLLSFTVNLHTRL